MTANVSVSVATREGVLRVPSAALRFRPPETGRDSRAGGGSRMAGTTAANAASGGGGNGDVRGAGGERRNADPRGGGRRRTEGGAGSPAMAGRGRGGARSEGARRPGGAGARDAGARPGAAPDVDRAMTLTAADAIGAMKPGRVYVLRAGKPVPVAVMTGLTDGVNVEVAGDGLGPGDLVVVGSETTTRGPQLTPPPGMGGMMGGPRGGGGRR
jgi:HlyD family secretion protein